MMAWNTHLAADIRSTVILFVSFFRFGCLHCAVLHCACTYHVRLPCPPEYIDLSGEVERGYCADFLIKSYEKDARKHVIHWWDIPGCDGSGVCLQLWPIAANAAAGCA